MKKLIAFLLLTACAGEHNPSPTHLEEVTIPLVVQNSQVDYKALYSLKDPYSKLVDNHGNGFDALYGVRNFRVVLHGVYYRGGANNAYNKHGVRNNQNPLPEEGLQHLCEEGFATAIYLYPTNYSSASKTKSCVDINRENRTLNYLQLSAQNTKNQRPILEMIFKRIKGEINGPIYGHCWNGWHASGLIAAITLKQYCDYTSDQAVEYWIKNTDGDSNYSDIKTTIRNFKQLEDLKITDDEKARVCP